MDIIDKFYIFSIGVVVGMSIIILIVTNYKEPYIRNSYDYHTFQAYCHEHSGKIITVDDRIICIKNNNLNDRVIMPSYYRLGRED